MNLNLKIVAGILILCLSAPDCYAQLCSVKEITQHPVSKYHTAKDTVIKYPLVTYKDQQVSDKINNTIKKEFYEWYELDKALPLRTGIRMAADRIAYMESHGYYCSEHLFSMQIEYESMGYAYPSSRSEYYNFSDLGNRLTLDSLIAPSAMNEFKALMTGTQAINIRNAIADIKERLVTKDIDSATFEWCMEQMKGECLDKYNPSKFFLTDSGITVIIDCEFPHAIESMSPDKDVFFSKQELSGMLRSRYMIK